MALMRLKFGFRTGEMHTDSADMSELQPTTPPPRPPFQFTLRTLLLLFVVLGSSLAVFGAWGIVVFGLVCGAGDLASRSAGFAITRLSCFRFSVLDGDCSRGVRVASVIRFLDPPRIIVPRQLAGDFGLRLQCLSRINAAVFRRPSSPIRQANRR